MAKLRKKGNNAIVPKKLGWLKAFTDTGFNKKGRNYSDLFTTITAETLRQYLR